jgi:hypothetical protein
VAAFRHALYPAGNPLREAIPTAGWSLGVTLMFGAVAIGLALLLARRRGAGAGP